MIAAVLLLGAASALASASLVPADSYVALEPELGARVFHSLGPVKLAGEAFERFHAQGRTAASFQLGVLVRPLDWLRVGAFLRSETGLRHDADWVFDPAAGTAAWEDTNSRFENTLTLEVAPRWVLADHFLGEVRTRVEHDTFNHEQTFVLRPGVTYFWMDDEGEPLVQLFFQLESWLPLNYARGRPMAGQWFYAGALYPVHPQLGVSGYLAYGRHTWVNTDEFAAATGQTFRSTQSSLTVGFALVVQLGGD